MPSAKARGAKPKKLSLKRDDARNKRKGKEVHELWFNPHAKKRGETLEEIYGCDCDCDVMLDENVQRELRRLSKVYSQTAVNEEDEEVKSKGFLCFKKSSQRSGSKQSEDKEKTKRRKSKEKEETEKVKRRKSKEKEDTKKAKRRKSEERESPRREHERKSRSRLQSSVHGRFKTQEEVRHYRELKKIYTTKPRYRQSNAKPTGTTRFKKQKDKRKADDAEHSLESSSDDSVYNDEHKSRKPEAERASKSRARSSKGDATSRQRRSQSQREDDKKNKKKEKKSNVGCCGARKKSKADKEEEEFEAYKLAQSAPKQSKKPTPLLECPLTPEEIELLEKLKQTYATEKPKVVRKAPPPPPPEEPGCCGSKSKKKKRRSEDEPYTPRKTQSAETNVKRKKWPKTGKSKSDSSFYTSDRKERHRTMKHKNCFCFDCIRRKCQSKPTKKRAKKPKEKPQIQTIKHPKKPVIPYEPHRKPEKPKKIDRSKLQRPKTESLEKLRKKESNVSCCSFRNHKIKKADTAKQKPAKTHSQQKVREQSPDGKKDSGKVGNKSSFLSCCSMSKKEKPKKEATPKAESAERVRKQIHIPFCCSFSKGNKSKKLDEVQQKPPKPKIHEKLPKKTSNVSCCSLPKSDKSKKQTDTQQKQPKVPDEKKPQKKESKGSCCSFTKKEKSKKLDNTEQKPPKAKESEKLPKKLTNASCCSIPKKDTTKKAKDHEKLPKKSLNVSCCSIPKKDKTKKDVELKQEKISEKVQKEPIKLTCCPVIKKDKPKKSDDSRKNLFKIWCSAFDKDTTKKEHDSKKVKSPSRKPSNISCCAWAKTVKPKKPESQEKPPRIKQKIKVKRKLFDSSCCPTLKRDKQKKSDDTQQKSPKKKLSEVSCCSIYKKHKPRKTEGSQQKPPRTKVKVKIKKKLSEASCCSVFQKDKQKKSDDLRQKPPRAKDQPKVKKKVSQVSCCSIFDKDKPDIPKPKPPKVKSTQKVQRKPSSISVFSCCSVDKSKPKTSDRHKRKAVKPDPKERSQNPFQTFCAFCKKKRTGKPKLMKPLSPIKYTTPARQEQIKPQNSRPSTKTKSEMSFQTCWDGCDDDEDNVPIREETKKHRPIPSETSAEKLKQTAPKNKSSCTSFLTCCSSLCVPRKTKRQRKSKRADKREPQQQDGVDEGAVKTKPEKISYCKALYQEFENLAMQQQLCPIMLPETNLDKKSKGTVAKYGLTYCQQNLSKLSINETSSSLKNKSKKKQEDQKETKEIRKPKAKKDKEIEKKLQKLHSATYIKAPKRKVKSEIQSENSTSDSGIENTYVPQYVLGKPIQLGVSLAHARNMTYNLILNSDTRRRSDKNFHKGFVYGIGCQN